MYLKLQSITADRSFTVIRVGQAIYLKSNPTIIQFSEYCFTFLG